MADRPDPNGPAAQPPLIKNTVDFDTGAHLIDCDPNNRRPNLQGQPMRDPLAVILTADGKLVERSVNADRNDPLQREAVASNEIGEKKLPPGKAVPEQRPAGVDPGGPGPGPEYLLGEPGMGGPDGI